MTAPRGIKRGRLTEAERAEIDRLALSMKRPTPYAIANRLNRHPATITWYMLRSGLLNRPAGTVRRPYERNGATVHPWKPEHDRRLTELRCANWSYSRIAAALTDEFGVPRKWNSVRVRAVMLAAAEDDEAAE